jgi:hypothetical protein
MKSLSLLSDQELVARFRDSVIDERERLVLQLEYLIELDRRRLFFEYPSLWAYLVHECGMEEWAADRKIRACRLMKRYPELRSLLESGKINLSLMELVQGYVYREKLEDSEFLELLSAVSGMSKRAAMRELASRYPQSRELPRDRIRPLDGTYSEVRFVADEALLEKIEEIRGLLAHSHPKGTIGEIFNHVLTDYLKRNDPEERAKRAEGREAKKGRPALKLESKTPSPAPAKVPPSPAPAPKRMPRVATQPMIQALIRQNGYRCSYVDPLTGKKCTSRHGLQVDHIQAWSRGGKTELKNLRYLCQGHHQRVSFLQFGESAKYFRPK